MRWFAAVLAGVLCWQLPAAGAHAGCDPQGRPPWADRLATSESGRQAAVLRAKDTINQRVSISSFAENLEIGYATGVCGSEADGCFVRTPITTRTTECRLVPGWVATGYYRVWVDMWTGCRYVGPVYELGCVWEPYTTSSTSVRRQISLSPCIFGRGWLNMDPRGEVLWDAAYATPGSGDANHLYYKFATSLTEALEFVCWHELAHAMGVMTEADADSYARHMVLENRKVERGLTAKFYLPEAEPGGSTRAITVACETVGPPPPLHDLPLGGDW